MKKHNILILFCGGTIIMQESQNGSLVTLDKEKALETLFNLEPKIKDLANFDISFISNIDSTNIEPKYWDKMASIIFENYNNYDGFIIIQGTDTMAYTSSALSFALKNLGKPVVLTGSQIPGNKIETDARRNLVNAVRVALMNIAEVLIVFGDKIILGSNASKVSTTKLNAFDTINGELLGKIKIDICLKKNYKLRHQQNLILKKGFEESVIVLDIFPGLHVDYLKQILQFDIKGIILRAYGPGNIGYKYINDIKLAREKKIPIIITTQCYQGATVMHAYDVGYQLIKAGAIQVYDMTIESTVAKLMWALKRDVKYEEIKDIMHHNYTGEINKPTLK